MTSFIDWFTPTTDGIFEFSSLWTSAPNNDFKVGQYGVSHSDSDSFMNIDPDSMRTYVELYDTLESDDSQFEFQSPFKISVLLHPYTVNDSSIPTDTVITISTASSRSGVFAAPDESDYPSISVSFRVSSEYLYIAFDGLTSRQPYTPCSGDTNHHNGTSSSASPLELYVMIYVGTYNLTLTVYGSGMTECGKLVVNTGGNLYIQSSSQQWNSLTIGPTSNSDTASLMYVAVISEPETETFTDPPTSAPSPSPTDLESECTDYTVPCRFGWEGPSLDRYQCQSDGSYLLIQNCYEISWGDEFLKFNSDLWTAVDPHYVAGKTALDSNSNDITFKVGNPSFVSVVRSSHEIVYPLKIRSTIVRNARECNSWFIALGNGYAPWSRSSVLLQWDCTTMEAALYNSSFKRVDPRCWSEEIVNGVTDTMDVTITTTNSEVTVRFDALSCSDLVVLASDLKSDDITPFLWFGTFESESTAVQTSLAQSSDSSSEDDEVEQREIVGRFSNMLYTHFYSEFNGFNQLIWQNIPSIDSGKYVVMEGGDRIIADDGYEFEIPFSVKMGIVRPQDVDELYTEPQSGRYAHFIVFGATSYAAEMRENVIQIVYDGLPKTRMVYTAYGVYVNSSGCDWRVYGKTFNVRIQIDGSLVSVTDDFCGTTLFAKHDLNATASNQSLMALGMIKSEEYSDSDIVKFDYIEVYQQPTLYYNQLLVEEETALSTTSTVATIYAVTEETTTSFLGLPAIYWIIFGAVLVATCCCIVCVMAWCLQCWPFGSKDSDELSTKFKKKNGHSPLAMHEPTSVPAADRFETDTPFRDETNAQYESDYKRTTSKLRRGGGGDGTEFKEHEDGMSLLNDINMIDDGAQTGNFMEHQQAAQQNWMMQRQMYLERQFIEMVMSDPNQQAALMSMNPLERQQYIQREMAVYVAAMSQNLQNVPPHILHQQIAMMNTNFNTNMNAEGGYEGGGGMVPSSTGITGLNGYGGGGGMMMMMMSTDQMVQQYNGYGGGGSQVSGSSRRLDAPNVPVPNYVGHPQQQHNGITPPPEYVHHHHQQMQMQQHQQAPYGQRQRQQMGAKGGPSFIRMMNPHQNIQSVHSASSQRGGHHHHHQNQQRNHFGMAGGTDSRFSSQNSRRSNRQRNQKMYASQLPAQPQLPSNIEMGAVKKRRRKSHKEFDIV